MYVLLVFHTKQIVDLFCFTRFCIYIDHLLAYVFFGVLHEPFCIQAQEITLSQLQKLQALDPLQDTVCYLEPPLQAAPANAGFESTSKTGRGNRFAAAGKSGREFL